MAGAQAAWGLDVGTTSLKAMKLRKDGDKVAVEAFEVIEHDKFLSEPEVDRDELIRHTLRKFLERNQLKKGESIFVGVPGSSTFARFVKLPPVDPKKIPEIVRFEAIQQIPFPLDQVNWDYQTFVNPESPDVEVGIFAMKKELVGQLLANFRSTGMTVEGVQMSPLAVYNAAAYDGLTDGKGSVLIDMGAEHTDLVIMDQGRLWLRTINIGGNHFTDALAKSFKQSFSRAESLKKTAATSKYQKQIFQAMRPIFADLVQEIQRSIGHYNSSHRDSRLERIVGMGNPFKLPNLQKYLQQELKMEVIRLDNFRKVVADGKLAAGLNDSILSMTAAYGLAVQGLGLASIDTNLLPLEIARQMMWRSKRLWFVAAAACIVVAAGFWQAQYWMGHSDFTSPQDDPLRAQDTRVISEAQKQADAGKRASTYTVDKQKAENFLKLAVDRSIWPSITTDLVGALPQAKGHPNAGSHAVVITAINSLYSGRLPSEVSSAPMSGSGFEENAMQPAPPTAGAVGGAAGEVERGFLIEIVGYVPNTENGEKNHEVVNRYVQDLLAQAPKGGQKPYYFTKAGNYSGAIIRGGTTSDTSATPVKWGDAKGPFFDVFAPDVAGIKLEETPGTGGAPASVAPLGNLGLIDLFIPHTPGTPPPSLEGAFWFRMKIKAIIVDKVEKS